MDLDLFFAIYILVSALNIIGIGLLWWKVSDLENRAVDSQIGWIEPLSTHASNSAHSPPPVAKIKRKNRIIFKSEQDLVQRETENLKSK
jgi:hypothetical protein